MVGKGFMSRPTQSPQAPLPLKEPDERTLGEKMMDARWGPPAVRRKQPELPKPKPVEEDHYYYMMGLMPLGRVLGLQPWSASHYSSSSTSLDSCSTDVSSTSSSSGSDSSCSFSSD
jgi:hypothetical protein